MQLRTAAVLAIAGALGAVQVASAGGTGRTLSFRIAGNSWHLGRSDRCPAGSVRYGIESRAGAPIGTATVCVLATRRLTGGAGAGGPRVVKEVEETDAFREGWLRSRLTYDFQYAPGSQRANVAVAGVVVGGTGRYARARGTVAGHGPFTVDRKGEHPSIAVSVRLR